MKYKLINHVITLSFFLFFISGCKKNDVQNDAQIIKPKEKEIVSKINLWMDKKIAATANQRTTDQTLQDIIKSVKDNLDFSNLSYEDLTNEEKFVIVPINKGFKSLNNQDKNPINVLLFVLDKNKNIRKGEIVQYMPVNPQLTSVPVNTFYNFFNFKKIADDATLTFLNIKDAFLREYKIKDGKMLNYRRVQKKNTDKERVICTNYYMVYTWEDGSEEWHYLYSVCEDVPCELARMIKGLIFRTDCGGGGGGGENQESTGQTVSRQVELEVYRETTPPQNWKIFGVFTLTGMKFSNANDNYFTSDPSHNISECLYYNAITGGWPQDSWYSIFSELNHSSGLINSTTASGRVEAQMYYPNLPQTYGGPQYKYYGRGETWQASIALY